MGKFKFIEAGCQAGNGGNTVYNIEVEPFTTFSDFLEMIKEENVDDKGKIDIKVNFEAVEQLEYNKGILVNPPPLQKYMKMKLYNCSCVSFYGTDYYLNLG